MSAEANMRMVVFMFRRDRSSRLTAKSHGRGPDEMLYGLLYFDPSKYETSYLEGDQQGRGLLERFWYPVEAVIVILTGMGFKLDLIVRNWKTIVSADAIVVTTDSCGLPVAMCKALGICRVPTVYVSQGLADRVQRRPWVLRSLVRVVYGLFLRAVDRIVVLGAGAAAPLRDEFRLKEREVVIVPFGIDEEFWSPGPQGQEADFVLSVGSDPARDYETLLRAWSGGDLRIVSRKEIPKGLVVKGVSVGSEYDDLQLRDLYQGAQFVVVPLVDVSQPSGQSVTLQAMACAKAVILTRTAGLWDPDALRHMENCYLVEPGDVQGLRDGIEYLKCHPTVTRRIGAAARQMVEERWTSRGFAERMAEQVEFALQAGRVAGSG
jgi:glycosyltransferase involved in cell wall biosynthesis